MDDEDIVMNVAKRFLEHAHIRVMTACNGAEAVDIYQKHAGNRWRADISRHSGDQAGYN